MTLLPPVCIAEKCEVQDGATVGSRTSLGKSCFVGEGATVEGSILFEGAQAGERAVVRDSIVGPGAVVRSDCDVLSLSVLGAGCVVGESNVLDRGARVNPRVRLQRVVLAY